MVVVVVVVVVVVRDSYVFPSIFPPCAC